MADVHNKSIDAYLRVTRVLRVKDPLCPLNDIKTHDLGWVHDKITSFEFPRRAELKILLI